MRDTDSAVQRGAREFLLEVGDLADSPNQSQPVVLTEDGNAGRVIATVLEPS
jgi:hypothetical protein